jgi:hypothetical protein
MRPVVVLPAPLGPKKPNVSPVVPWSVLLDEIRVRIG